MPQACIKHLAIFLSCLLAVLCYLFGVYFGVKGLIEASLMKRASDIEKRFWSRSPLSLRLRFFFAETSCKGVTPLYASVLSNQSTSYHMFPLRETNLACVRGLSQRKDMSKKSFSATRMDFGLKSSEIVVFLPSHSGLKSNAPGHFSLQE